jgi:hypothetical protein
MSSKKRLAAVVVTIAALTAGSVGIASAHDKGAGRDQVIAELVTAGTITQVQADAIIKKFAEKHAVNEAKRAAKKAAGGKGLGHKERGEKMSKGLHR